MKYNKNELIDILIPRQEELKEYLNDYLIEFGYSIENKKGFLYARGSVPVLLVAHLDTVHREKAGTICFSDDGRYVMSPQGIGGDDRCGVYIIMQIIKKYKCHILFCEDEEIGGRGATAFVRSKIKPEINYIIEMDRRGDNDAVFYDCYNEDFEDFVLNFGFKKNRGSFSDISIIAPHLETAAVNISAGYYNEHQTHEYIDMLALENNIQRISKMVCADTEHFVFVSSKEKCKQMSMFGDWAPMDYQDTGKNVKRKTMMELPETAHIVTNGYPIDPSSKYMMDKEGNLFIFLPEIEAVVASEHSFACDDNGEQIIFSADNGIRLQVISMEEAIERLTLSE